MLNNAQMPKDVELKIFSHMLQDLQNMGFERWMENFKEFYDNP